MKIPADDVSKMCGPLVYLFRDKDGQVVYVGASTIGVRRPLSNGHKMQELIKAGEKLSLELVYCATADDAFTLEIELIQKHKPKYNVQGYPIASQKVIRGLKWREHVVCSRALLQGVDWCQCQACTDLRQNSQPVSD